MCVRRIALVGLLVACDRDPASRRHEPPRSLPAQATHDASAANDASAAPEPAIAARSIPPELAAAPAWIFRRHYTGMIAMPRVTTFTLRRHAGAAYLTIDRAEGQRGRTGVGPQPPGTGPIAEWRPVSTARYLGTEAGNVLSLTGIDQPEPLVLRCDRYVARVARPEAVRKRSAPPKGGCEGETGRFVPAATTRAELLYCHTDPATPPDPDDPYAQRPRPDEADLNGYADGEVHAAFTRAPGVEWLYVNDDCVMQGGGFRRIPDDGSIRPER